ncbi:MAG TPA: alkaline phosphatase family protein [Casimicrobiaceae bacterium]
MQQFRRHQKAQPHLRRVSSDHDSFSSEQLPVLSTLAKQFAVYDAWHCSVPSQTATNRAFSTLPRDVWKVGTDAQRPSGSGS